MKYGPLTRFMDDYERILMIILEESEVVEWLCFYLQCQVGITGHERLQLYNIYVNGELDCETFYSDAQRLYNIVRNICIQSYISDDNKRKILFNLCVHSEDPYFCRIVLDDDRLYSV